MAGQRKGLAARYTHSEQTKDSGGGNPAFEWRKVKGQVSFFKPKDGPNRINIIPYEVKSKNHPLVKAGAMEIGDLDSVMDIWIHKNVGPGQTDVICLKKNYAKACPICEAAEKYKQDGKQKEFDALKASRRVLYNVVNLANPEAGIQVFEVSHYLFEKELSEEQRAYSGNQQLVSYADPDKGKVIRFRASEATLNGQKFFEYKSFQFAEREEPIEDEVLEHAISFDEVMMVHTYAEIEKILYGSDDDEEPKPKEKEEPKDEPKEEPKETKKTATKEKEEPKEEPKETKAPPKKDPPAKDTKEDKGSKGECPHGHKFGKDCDDFDECNSCKSWGKCVNA